MPPGVQDPLYNLTEEARELRLRLRMAGLNLVIADELDGRIAIDPDDNSIFVPPGLEFDVARQLISRGVIRLICGPGEAPEFRSPTPRERMRALPGGVQ
jgi:hypothetical protein